MIRWQNPNYFLLPDWQTRRIPAVRYRDRDAHFMDSLVHNWHDRTELETSGSHFEGLIDGTPGALRRIDRHHTAKFGHFVWNYLIPSWPRERPDDTAYGGPLSVAWRKFTGQLDLNVPALRDDAPPAPRRPDLLSYQMTPLFKHFPEMTVDCGDQVDWLLQKYALVKPPMLADFAPADVWHPLQFIPTARIICNVVGSRGFALLRPSRGAEMYPSPIVSTLSMVANPLCVNRDLHPSFPREEEIFAFTLQPGEALYVPPSWWTYNKAHTTTVGVEFMYTPTEGVGAHKVRRGRAVPIDWESQTETAVDVNAHTALRATRGIDGDPRRYQIPK